MDKIKRNERLAAMTQILTASPNRIFTLSHFCELFSTAKSTVSEDVAILQETMNRFRLGKLETVTGAAGGVRYRPIGMGNTGREFVEGICERLREPARHLPGGYLYFSDILAEPQLVQGMGTLIASQYYDANVDFVLTMETKGIPVALMAAQALRVPLIIARHATKVYEGSAVNISYVSGSGSIETMALSRRAVKEGYRNHGSLPPCGEGRAAVPDRGRFHARRRHRPGHDRADEGIFRHRGGHLLCAGPGKSQAPLHPGRKIPDGAVRHQGRGTPADPPRGLDRIKF